MDVGAVLHPAVDGSALGFCCWVSRSGMKAKMTPVREDIPAGRCREWSGVVEIVWLMSCHIVCQLMSSGWWNELFCLFKALSVCSDHFRDIQKRIVGELVLLAK